MAEQSKATSEISSTGGETVTPPTSPQEENTELSLGSMATGTPHGHAPIAKPVCSLHKTPKRAHYYCLQCVEAGEYEVNISSVTVRSDG